VNTKFLGTMSMFRMNIEDAACFDYGRGPKRECEMPPPTTIIDLNDYDRTYWLGDAEPVLQWLARV
jgi:hypothetical protein